MKEKEEESNNFLLFLIIPCNKIILYASVSQPKAMLAEMTRKNVQPKMAM